MLADADTDMTKLVVAFRTFVKAPDTRRVRKLFVCIDCNYWMREITFGPVNCETNRVGEVWNFLELTKQQQQLLTRCHLFL
jgi:hypothetical protein